jgi:hypothetical protein
LLGQAAEEAAVTPTAAAEVKMKEKEEGEVGEEFEY